MDIQDTSTEVTAFDFQDYDPKAVPALPAGHRMSKCQYKEDKKTGVKRDSSFLFLPEVVEPTGDWLVTFMPHFIGMMETAQDKLIKAIHVNDVSTVQARDVDYAAILESLEATGEGRLTTEKVLSWFDTEVKDLLIVAFADNLGISNEPSEEEAKQLSANVEIYRTRYGALAGNNSVFVPEECDKLLKALVVTGVKDTGLGVRFTLKLEKIKADQLKVLPSL